MSHFVFCAILANMTRKMRGTLSIRAML